MPASLGRRRSASAAPARYEDNVFINCPFDRDYQPIFQAVTFAVHACGFYARSSLEAADSAENRLEKIMRIIEESRFGIHDISRTEPGASGLPRFNMPLELGLFLGCRRFGSSRDHRKVCLVLDRDRFRYQRYISDIAGQDIAAHDGRPDRAVAKVCDWLRTSSKRKGVPGGAAVWTRYQAFEPDLPKMADEIDLKPEELLFVDRTQLISRWLIENAG